MKAINDKACQDWPYSKQRGQILNNKYSLLYLKVKGLKSRMLTKTWGHPLNKDITDVSGNVMARPLRIEYKGVFCHTTSRGNERRRICFVLIQGLTFFCIFRAGTGLTNQDKDGSIRRGPLVGSHVMGNLDIVRFNRAQTKIAHNSVAIIGCI
jgi:hypothetical protein